MITSLKYEIELMYPKKTLHAYLRLPGLLLTLAKRGDHKLLNVLSCCSRHWFKLQGMSSSVFSQVKLIL